MQGRYHAHARRAPSRAPAGRPSPATRRASASPCPLTAAASGTVASISSCPARSASLRLVSVSDWLRKGTLRITVAPARHGAGVVGARRTSLRERPPLRARRSRARGSRRASRSRSGRPVPRRAATASPKPSAPEAPIMATGSVLVAGARRAEYRLVPMTPQGSAWTRPRGEDQGGRPARRLPERAGGDPDRRARSS